MKNIKRYKQFESTDWNSENEFVHDLEDITLELKDEGMLVGFIDGTADGSTDGSTDGSLVGCPVGCQVGFLDGHPNDEFRRAPRISTSLDQQRVERQYGRAVHA